MGFDEKIHYHGDAYFAKILHSLQNGQQATYPHFMLKDGFHFKALKLCVPQCSLREQILIEQHNLGHFGKDKTLELLQRE